MVAAQAAFERVPPTPVPPGGVRKKGKGRGKGSRSRSRGKGGKDKGKGRQRKGGGKANRPPFHVKFGKPGAQPQGGATGATRIVKIPVSGKDAQKGADKSRAP